LETVPKAESSKIIRQRVEAARALQRERFKETATFCNAGMTSKELREYCQVGPDGRELLRQAVQRFSLSARAYTRILKLALTIADLDESPKIEISHLAEAIQYRSLDRKGIGWFFCIDKGDSFVGNVFVEHTDKAESEVLSWLSILKL
jgi:magnesium chelatase family protein